MGQASAGDPESAPDVALSSAISRAQGGDISELASLLLGPFRSRLERACRNRLSCQADIDEAISATLEQVTKSINSLREPSGFRSWLWTITDRCAVEVANEKVKKLGYLTDPSALPDMPQEQDSTDLILALGLIRGGLDRLNRTHPEEVEALVLYYVIGKTYSEISEHQGVEVSTVGVRLFRGKRRLEKLLRSSDHV